MLSHQPFQGCGWGASNGIPRLIKLLLSYGIYDDPIVASLLRQQANRWQARRR